MNIDRKPVDESTRSGIYHRIADKPNGVTVKTDAFPEGVTTLPEATLLTEGSNGLYNAIAQVKIVETASGTAVEYAIAKGSFVNVGTSLIKSASVNVSVTEIDRSNPDKDVITVDATLGAKAVGDVVTEKVAAAPVCITGEAVAISKGKNCFASLWLIAVVNKNVIPEPSVKPAGVIYV